jgi:hypothetical protein
VKFNTTRGGEVAGDDIYRAYDVIFQQVFDGYDLEHTGNHTK